MSQIVELENNEVQYVQYDDNTTEYIMDPGDLNINSDELADMVYSDGTRAILVNGHFLQGDGQTYVLQESEDLNEYYINSDDAVLVANDQDQVGEDSNAEIVQYIEDDESAEAPQVVYVTSDELGLASLPEGFHIDTSQESEQDSQQDGKFRPDMVDLEELLKQSNGEASVIQATDENGTSYQYAILKDGKLHFQTIVDEEETLFTPQEEDNQQQSEIEETPENSNANYGNKLFTDLSQITGKNLLTGQTVTLHGYMEKLQKKINKTGFPAIKQVENETSSDVSVKVENVKSNKRKLSEVSDHSELSKLINKKIPIGKMPSGKKLVGKIVNIMKKQKTGDHMETVETSVSNEMNEDAVELENHVEDETDQNETITPEEQELAVSQIEDKKVIVKPQKISKDYFESISKTLGGCMNMDSVKKHLQNKNIVAKIIDRKYNSETVRYDRSVSYCYGYMNEQISMNQNGEMIENWEFITDSNQEFVLGGGVKIEDVQSRSLNSKYQETINIKMMITQDKTGERVTKVILNPKEIRPYTLKCSYCSKEFRSNLQLRLHINNIHNVDGKQTSCEVCLERYDDINSLHEHRKIHVAEGRLFQCKECNKVFLTLGRLNRHIAVHNVTLRPLECLVCFHRCSNESSLKKHLMTHMNVKPFSCELCGKSYSNQGDLNFHQRIHDPYKYFQCAICHRTFSRHSNLQRHLEIHKGAGAMYRCDICGCSYHYISSLTRHVVQNHIQVSRPEEVQASETVVEAVES